MQHIIISLSIQDEYTLRVKYLNGFTKDYDVQKLFSRFPLFQRLKNNPDLFERVKICSLGLGIIWDDNLSISSDEIYENGIVIEAPSVCRYFYRPGTNNSHFAKPNCIGGVNYLSSIKSCKPYVGVADYYNNKLCPSCGKPIQMDYSILIAADEI